VPPLQSFSPANSSSIAPCYTDVACDARLPSAMMRDIKTPRHNATGRPHAAIHL
jgi:hypothetical protein